MINALLFGRLNQISKKRQKIATQVKRLNKLLIKP